MKNERSRDQLKSYFKRCGQSTPPFFRKIRAAGLVVLAVGSGLMAAPIALPGVMISLGGYLALAGGMMVAVSQATVNGRAGCEDN
jgi:hypothetical protein